MIRTGLLLAAGASRRFGPEDKLLAPLHGRPLVSHAAEALRRTPLDHRIAIIANPALEPHLSGFRIIRIAPGQISDSLRAGLAAAGRPDRLLIALGDMPLVTADHLARVLALANDKRPSASLRGAIPMPPACFPRGSLPQLAMLGGDQGAGRLLKDLPAEALIAAPELLADIDTPPDLTDIARTDL